MKRGKVIKHDEIKFYDKKKVIIINGDKDLLYNVDIENNKLSPVSEGYEWRVDGGNFQYDKIIVCEAIADK